MLFKEQRLLKFKYLIFMPEICYNPSNSIRIKCNCIWMYYFKTKIYKNLYIVSNGYWFHNLSVGIK